MVDIGRDPATGKRRLKSHGGFRTRRDAERALSKMLEQINQGSYVEPSRMTLAEYLPRWLETARLRGLRATTLVGYEVMITRQLVPRIGALQLRELTPAHLNALYVELVERGRLHGPGGLSPRTVRAAHTVLRRALADAVRQGLLARNVAELADPPSAAAAKAEARKAVKTWTPEQLRQFLEHTREHPLYPAFQLGAMTGMRRGEVLGLRWQDLDLDNRSLSVTQTLVAPRYQLVFSEPKTEAGRRQVSLDERTVAALRERRRQQAAERLAFGRGYQETGTRVHAGRRLTARPADLHPTLPESQPRRRAPTDSLSRPPPRPRHLPDASRRATPGDRPASRPFKCRGHGRHLQPRAARNAERHRGRVGADRVRRQ